MIVREATPDDVLMWLRLLSAEVAGTDAHKARGAVLVANVLAGRGEWAAAARMLDRAERLLS